MAKKIAVYAPCRGIYVPLAELKDEAFSSGSMGAGFGVIPSESTVRTPVSGTLSMVFPTGHAFGITTDEGLEVLVHIGVDTVGLNGKGFTTLKKQGDKVKAGDPVVSVDFDAVRAAGLDDTVMTLFPGTEESAITWKGKEGEICEVTKDETEDAPVKEETKAEAKKDVSGYEYGELCNQILNAFGGSKNIQNVFHCVTRLRLVPVNRDLVDMEALKKVKGVLKVIESSGQIQCVIGTDVPYVYEDFVKISGVEASGAVDEDLSKEDIEEKKPNIIIRGLNTLAACVTPGLYAIIAGGMIKGIISLLTATGLVSSSADAITVLNAIGDAPFYFMPFVIGYAAAKRFRVNEVFGIMTAGILMYSTFLSPAEGVTGYKFLFFNIPAYNYKGSIFPVILSVWLFSVIYHFIDRHMPKNLRIVFSGALSFIIAAPLFLAFLAPLGNMISNVMVGSFQWLFTHVGPFAGALFCGIIPLTIIFGIKGWSAVELANIENLGYDYMLPNFFYSNLAVSGALLGSAVRLKASEEKSAMISTGLVCILGITEPALYGYALPKKKPLAACMIGGAIAGALAVILGVVTYSFSMPGITSIATYFDDGNNFLMLLIVMAAAWLSSFIISFFLTGKQKA